MATLIVSNQYLCIQLAVCVTEKKLSVTLQRTRKIVYERFICCVYTIKKKNSVNFFVETYKEQMDKSTCIIVQ